MLNGAEQKLTWELCAELEGVSILDFWSDLLTHGRHCGEIAATSTTCCHNATDATIVTMVERGLANGNQL